jgi:hypothetical protein
VDSGSTRSAAGGGALGPRLRARHGPIARRPKRAAESHQVGGGTGVIASRIARFFGNVMLAPRFGKSAA